MSTEGPPEPPEPDARATQTAVRRGALLVTVGGGLAVAFLARAGVLIPPDGLAPEGVVVAGVMVAMAGLWILEALPLAVTALIPLVAFPVLGVSPAKVVAKDYAHTIIMLLMGGFLLAKGLERWGVPVHLAQLVERWARGSATRLLYGLMGVTALLSMWLSNTATTLVMATVATAAVARARASDKNAPGDLRAFQVALLLGIAYAANIGGLATPVGTAPNALLIGLYGQHASATGIDNPLTFLVWMELALPVVIVLLPLMAVLLYRVLCPFPGDLDLGRARDEGGHVGVRELWTGLSPGGQRALLVFAATAAFWVFRRNIDLGAFVIPGWAPLLGLGKLVDDGTVAMAGAIAMFACPAGEGGERVLNWSWGRRFPWYLLLLFGGGLALAGAFAKTGLSAWLGGQLVGLAGAPVWLLVLVLSLGMSFLTEVTSNTATTTLVLPVLLSAGAALELPPLLLMYPATLCASAAFILPISTPPNAIAAGAGNITMPEMARIGVGLNLLAVVVVTVATLILLPALVDL